MDTDPVTLLLGFLSTVCSALVWVTGRLWNAALECQQDRKMIRQAYIDLLIRIAKIESKPPTESAPKN